jgi:hypothetical protein
MRPEYDSSLVACPRVKGHRPQGRVRLGNGQGAYQADADARSTLRAYAADLANFQAWCEACVSSPCRPTPETVGATGGPVRQGGG